MQTFLRVSVDISILKCPLFFRNAPNFCRPLHVEKPKGREFLLCGETESWQPSYPMLLVISGWADSCCQYLRSAGRKGDICFCDLSRYFQYSRVYVLQMRSYISNDQFVFRSHTVLFNDCCKYLSSSVVQLKDCAELQQKLGSSVV